MNGHDAIEISPLAAAVRGEQGSIVLFCCKLPSNNRGEVRAWATRGERKRLLTPVEIRRDYASDGSRKVVCAVLLPEGYSACTLHVWVRDGVQLKFASCRVPEEQFRKLAAASCTAEGDPHYQEWLMGHRASEAELANQRVNSSGFKLHPLFSIVIPIYRTPARYLTELIDSVLAQTYGSFELIIVNVSGECPEVDEVLSRYDDSRIRVIAAPNRTIPENTNVGIAAAKGDYVVFVDHDDFIEPDALYCYVETINEHPDCDLLYCDEDLWREDREGGRFEGVRFKPGWSPDLLYTHNIVCHMLAVSRWALDRTERSTAEVNGAQDYDLTFKAAEVARDIRWVPRVLYHWRTHPASTSSNRESKPYALEAGRLAVQGHFDRRGSSAIVEYGTAPFSYRVKYEPFDASDVTLVSYSGNASAHAQHCGTVSALGGEVELIACGRGSLNDAVEMSRGSVVVLLDEAVEFDGDGWLDEIVSQLRNENVGCCSPLLSSGNLIVRSGGLGFSRDGHWVHRHVGFPIDAYGYLEMLDHVHNVSAVSSLCMAFRKDAYGKVGGFDESLDAQWMGIDYCLRLYGRGYRTVIAPRATVFLPDKLDIEVMGRDAIDSDAYRAFLEADPYDDVRICGDGMGFGLKAPE